MKSQVEAIAGRRLIMQGMRLILAKLAVELWILRIHTYEERWSFAESMVLIGHAQRTSLSLSALRTVHGLIASGTK